MNEDKAARYQRLHRRARMLTAGWIVLLLVLVLTTGASRSMGDASLELVHRLGIPALIATAASAGLYAVVLACLLEAGTLPLAFYSSFVLERRFGLSRQRLGPWLADHLKGLAIDLGLWGAAAGFIYACMMAWLHWWWMPAWAGVAVVGVALTWAAPVALLPLFLRVAPLENDALRTRLVALVRQVGTEPVTSTSGGKTTERHGRMLHWSVWAARAGYWCQTHWCVKCIHR